MVYMLYDVIFFQNLLYLSIMSRDFVTITVTKPSDATDMCDSVTSRYSNPNPRF